MGRRKLIQRAASAAVIYVGIYCSLSLFGRYEPTIWGMGQFGYAPKSAFYAWAPRGFVSDWRWNMALFAIYYPMLKIDQSLWHTDSDRWTGRYPVHDFVVLQPEQ